MWDLRKCIMYNQNQELPPFESHKEAVNMSNINPESADFVLIQSHTKTDQRCLEKADVCWKNTNLSTLIQVPCFLLCNNHVNCRWQPEPKSGGHWSCAAFVPFPHLSCAVLSKLFWPPRGLGSVHKHHCLLVCWLPARRNSGLWDLLTLLCPDCPFIHRLGSTHTLSVPQRDPQWTARAAWHSALRISYLPFKYTLCPHSE